MLKDRRCSLRRDGRGDKGLEMEWVELVWLGGWDKLVGWDVERG